MKISLPFRELDYDLGFEGSLIQVVDQMPARPDGLDYN